MLRHLSVFLLVLAAGTTAWPGVIINAGELRGEFTAGVFTSLADRSGTIYANGPQPNGRGNLRLLDGDLVPAADGEQTRTLDLPATIRYRKFAGERVGELEVTISAGGSAGELIVQQSGKAGPGLHGVQWGIAGVPTDYDIIVPGRSGIKLDHDVPGGYFGFSYPLGWEAQFVIVQGKKGGFWVWAEDAKGRYKTLRIWKHKSGWDLAFETQNAAPFEGKDAIESVRWHLAAYEGDWRAPARQYRQWAQEHFGLTELGDQQPAWVKDIRLLVICGLDLNMLDLMAAEFDPSQTILYAPGWRRDGYDRNYPDYTAVPALAPFMEKAHELGFKVMLHVNYFGCDPENELYARFEPFQARHPFSKEKLWWDWKRAKPPIKFAYINPACRAWRELFVSRMKELCDTYDVDALHLDQTLCIWNHAGGPIDGMTMLEGNIAEHRELRKALPHVALSGEGLNEAAFRHEAFAQRHVWGISHTEQTWNRRWLARAHPVSSYIFRPYTIINGYLGMSSPANDQLYAAWMQAYVNWGLIPTFAGPSPTLLRDPTGFARQILDEISFFQAHRVDPDMEAPWPEDTMFPFRSASGKPVRYVADKGFALVAGEDQDTVISRTVTGVTEIIGPGSIPGWLAYNAERIFGLNPEAWYPLLEGDRDLNTFHVAAVPPGMRIDRITRGDELAVLATEDPNSIVAWASKLLDRARCGYTVFGGEGEEGDGPLTGTSSGASLQAASRELITLHPPWKATRRNPDTGVLEAQGTGLVYAVAKLKLPAGRRLQFLSEVYMEPGAVGEGKTDGVVFSIEATDGAKTRRAQVHATNADPTPLSLDLTEFAGREVTIRLAGDPGPKRSATFDWARWRNARIEVERSTQGTARIVSPDPWKTVIASEGRGKLREVGPRTYEIDAVFPGTLYLSQVAPQLVDLPCDLTKLPLIRSYVSHRGTALQTPQHASGHVAANTVNDVSRPGFFAHPPDQGQTRLEFPIQLPARPASFHAAVGLRDGSVSEGCLFIIEVSGKEVARQLVVPGQWHEMTVDLAAWTGRLVVLSLVTDSDTTHYYDWAAWGDPRLE